MSILIFFESSIVCFNIILIIAGILIIRRFNLTHQIMHRAFANNYGHKISHDPRMQLHHRIKCSWCGNLNQSMDLKCRTCGAPMKGS
jgi:hypothetical protein